MGLQRKYMLTTFQSFNELGLPAQLLQSIEKLKYVTPTPVQAAAIPFALAGKDVLATAQTGTGKTAAFAIPMLTWLMADHTKCALILAPTRELAAQIYQVIRNLSSGMKMRGALLVGGESFNRQADDLYQGIDYIVATPGRLNDHLEQNTVDLSVIDILVVDEFDRMLDMGFAPQVKQIMKYVSNERQTLLFSATLPPEIMNLANSYMKNPERIAINPVLQAAPEVKEETIHTTQPEKNNIILKEMEARKGRILVFTRTKSRTDRLARLLFQSGHEVVSLHGGHTQSQRKSSLEKFRRGSHRIMVATDLASRGIDVNDICHVINYDLPESREDYIHRIGRTGRSGKTGNALNLLTALDTDAERVLTGKKSQNNRPQMRSRRPQGRRFR